VLAPPFHVHFYPWVRPARTGKCAGYSFGKTLPEMDARLISAFRRQGHNRNRGPGISILLFACLLACALARQRFLYPFLFSGLQVKRVTFYFFNDVLLLHFPLKATQGVFERLAFLQSDFCQKKLHPQTGPVGLVSYCKTSP